MDYYSKNTEDYKPAMGERIRTCRQKSNMTQEKMAEILDISVKHYSEVERGLTGLSVEKLIYLSNLFGVSLDYLLKGNVEEDSIPFLFREIYQNCPEQNLEHLMEIIKHLRQLVQNTDK